jgi:hypothetical protein
LQSDLLSHSQKIESIDRMLNNSGITKKIDVEEINVVNSLQLGDRYKLYGYGINADPWLKLVDKTGSSLIGGFAANELWSAKGVLSGSDVRLKTNINDVSDELIECLSHLQPKTYLYKDDSKRKIHYGLIAQEVEAVMPDIVETGPNGMKSIRYQDLIPLLVKKIQTLEKKLKAN